MPWVRRSSQSNRAIWITGILIGIGVGVLSAYQQWGSTAAVVSIVEKELSRSQAHITVLEQRVTAMEAKLGMAAADAGGNVTGEREPGLSKAHRSVADASYKPAKVETKPPPRVETY